MSLSARNKSGAALTVREAAVFAMLGALMFVSKQAMAFLPNIHLLGMLTITVTVVFRGKALYPIYLYVLAEGIFQAFSPWWVPYLYIWTLLWGAVMLLPKKMSPSAAAVVYPVLCCLHGLLFGTLYAPVYALLFGLDWQEMLAWIAMGFEFDVLHAVSNLLLGTLVLPLSALLRKLADGKFAR